MTLSRGRDEETELLPMEPVSRTGRTDLKFWVRIAVFESTMDCLSCSFSESRREFWNIRSLFCCLSLGRLLMKDIWVSATWRSLVFYLS
ncbi:MAG: hypothetical protein UV28_C0029G0027 [Candidatus Collierbacteria bacterium GW2011_GWE2_42_48]|nr:MAG: hypothetical protein UV28_C0029G0027 [Candidatus Collierbacteria bacterium GW2011_GWE2_42_48]